MNDFSGRNTAASTYFDQAGAALERAFKATDLTQQGFYLEEALRLHRLAIAEEQAALGTIKSSVSGWASSRAAP